MVYLDIQDIITSHLENILNEGETNFKIGYYNMVSPNEFNFIERLGSKYKSTDFVPCMLENWEGSWEPLPGIEYIEINLTLTVMVQLNAYKDQKYMDLHEFARKLIGRYDNITLTDVDTSEESEIALLFGSGILRPIGGSITWGGKRYIRMMLPISVVFSRNSYVGNMVQNTIDGILLAPVSRSYSRESEPYPVQLLTGGADTNSKLTKKNINKENAWTSTLSFVWNDDTDFIIKYLMEKDYTQNKTFNHTIITKNWSVSRIVRINSGSFTPTVGKGSVVTITIAEAF